MVRALSDRTFQKIFVIFSILILFVLVSIPVLIEPSSDISSTIIRYSALTGFVSLFLASVFSGFTRQIYQLFGRSYVQIHHLFAILGLILVTIHPLTLAVKVMSIAVFVPDVSSLENFLILGGRPAIYLIYISLFFGFARRTLPKYWRFFHMSIYIALMLAYIHGVLIGTDFANPIIFVLFTIMIGLSLFVLVYKRYVTWKRKKGD